MSRFSNALQDALKKRGITESALAAASGVPQSKINRWCLGRTAPKGESLAAVLPQFDAAIQAALCVAYVRDVAESVCPGLLTIAAPESARLAKPASEYNATPRPPEGLSSELLGQVYRVAELARDVPEIAAIFAEFDRLIQRRAIG